MCRCDAYASYWHAFGWLRHAVARVLCPGFLAIRLLPCTVSRLSLDSTVFVFLRTPVSLMKALKASSWRFSDIHPHLQFAMTCDWKWGVMWNSPCPYNALFRSAYCARTTSRRCATRSVTRCGFHSTASFSTWLIDSLLLLFHAYCPNHFSVHMMLRLFVILGNAFCCT